MTRSTIRCRPGAFSLIELMLVLVLMGILAGSAAVALQGRDRPEALRLAAEDLATAVGHAAAAANRSGRTHFWVPTADGRGYRLLAAAAGADLPSELDEPGEPLPGIGGRQHRLPSGINFVAAISRGEGEGDASGVEPPLAGPAGANALPLPPVARFEPNGGSSVRIGLINLDGEQRWVETTAGMGQVRILHVAAEEGSSGVGR